MLKTHLELTFIYPLNGFRQGPEHDISVEVQKGTDDL